MHAVTRKQHAQALEIGIVGLALQGRGGRLVEAAHALLDLAQATSVAPSSASPSISRSGTSKRRPSSAARTRELRRPVAVSPPAVREVALVEGEPAVLGPGLERVEQAMRTREPAARHGGGAVEIELVDREPGRHARGAAHRPPLAR